MHANNGLNREHRTWLQRCLRGLARPAIQVMGRIRLGRQVVLLGVLATLATVVAVGFFVPMLGRDIVFVRQERIGVQAVPPLLELITQMQVHRGTLNRLLKGDASAGPQVEQAREAAAAASARFDRFLASEQGARLGVGQHWAALRQGWETLAGASPGMSPQESFQQHTARVEEALALLSEISQSSKLILDPELASWMLADSSLVRLPRYMELVGVMRGKGAGAIAAHDTSVATNEAVNVIRGIAGFVHESNQGAFLGVIRSDPEMAALGRQVEELQALHDRYMAATHAQFSPVPTGALSSEAYFAQGTEVVEHAGAVVLAALPQLDRLLAARHASLERSRTIVLTACVLGIALEIYAFLGFTLSLTGTLRRLSRACHQLGDGQFPEPIVLRSNDELQTIAEQTTHVSRILQQFDTAQRDVAARHAQGDTGARMDVHAFAGAYGQMAAAVNGALEGHIHVQQRMTEVMERYARGDLSVRIEDMPGQRAQISAAINQVRDRLDLVNRQIMTLADAAARGEFSVRGETQGLEFAYAEMVDGLNTLMRNAASGLGDLDRFMSALADGDLGARMPGEYSGMFAHLRDSAHQTAERLNGLVGRIHVSADGIDLAAGEIGLGNAQLSGRTERQAAALGTAAEQVSASARAMHQTAHDAERASELALETRRCAEDGGKVMLRTVASMRGLQHSSSRIQEITGLIDGIAFQTNILALNAAVEAARAGEQGRGFAVVASEVRTLAQRCASAAQDIGQLIAQSVREIAEGSQMAEEAGTRMDEVVRSVNEVSEIMQAIAGSSRTQREQIDEVSAAIVQMDGDTQQNAALAEEATAAAQSLGSEVSAMMDMIRMFRLREDAVGTPPVAAVPASVPA